MSEDLKLLIYLLLFALPLIASLLEKARKKQVKAQERADRQVRGQARKAAAPTRGSTGQRPNLAEWIEELRRRSGAGGDVAAAPPGRPLHEDVAPEEPLEQEEVARETGMPTPPPLSAPETESEVQPEEAPLTEAAQLVES